MLQAMTLLFKGHYPLIFLVGCTLLVPAEVKSGSIKGRVVWGLKELPKEVKINPTTDTWLCSKADLTKRDLVVDTQSKGVRWAALWLESRAPSSGKQLQHTSKTLALNNKRCAFEPHIFVMSPGDSLDNINSDPLLHNTHLAAQKTPLGEGGDSFNIALLPKSPSRQKKVFDEGVYSITCDVHPWMKAWVIVQKHESSQVSTQDGSFHFDKIAAGSYTLHLWHERLGHHEKAVLVGQDELSDIKFILKP
jgi:plastocyanin